MKHFVSLFVLTLALCAWWTSSAEGHGGAFPPPPPPPYVPGTWNGGPGDITGVGGGGMGGPSRPGPSSPGPTAPAAPRPSGPKGPNTPGPNGPGAPGGGAPATPAGMLPDILSWEWWWLYNRDPYLSLKQRVLAGGPATGSDEFFLGLNTRVDRKSAAPSDNTIRTVVGPALQRAIEAEFSDRVLCDSMIALAKLHPTYVPDGYAPMLDMFSAHLDHPNQKVVESAVVALGLMGDPACASLLCDIAEDGEAGRELVGRESVPSRTRALAALAVGLVGNRCDREDVRRYIIHRLAVILNGERQPSPDLHVGCITSFGLTPISPARRAIEEGVRVSPASSREGQVQFLAELLADRDRPELVRAHVPKALGLLVRDTDGAAKTIAAEALLDVLQGRKKHPRLVRHGVVEGLGLVGDADEDRLDVEIRKALRVSVRDGDAYQRQLSVVAIALSSSRPGSGAGEKIAGLAGERDYLLEQLVKGQSRLRPWVALALGLQAHHSRQDGDAAPPTVCRALRESMAKVGSPADVGAWCVALGLCGDTESVPALHDRLEDLNDDFARGRVAVALGLLGDPEAIEPLHEIVAEASFRPDLLRESAIGLALLGDKEVIDGLIEVLATRDSMAVKSAALAALGFVSDQRAIDPLVGLLEDEQQLDVTRSYAAIAMGVICEKDLLPWPALYSNHFNYEGATETLITGKGTGILNLR